MMHKFSHMKGAELLVCLISLGSLRLLYTFGCSKTAGNRAYMEFVPPVPSQPTYFACHGYTSPYLGTAPKAQSRRLARPEPNRSILESIFICVGLHWYDIG